MPRRRAISGIALVCLGTLAAGLAGCADSLQVLENTGERSTFNKPSSIFSKPSWAQPISQGSPLGPSGPVALEDMVGADGRCAPAAPDVAQATQAKQPAPVEAAAPAAQPAAAEPPPDRAVGSMAGDLAGPPMPAAPPPAIAPTRVAAIRPEAVPDELQIEAAPAGPRVIGGIALGMTECDAVRRAGQPNNVSIGAGEKGERRVVLTYLGGNRPGIYTFDAGRLKEIDRAPEPPAPPPTKKLKKKISKKKPAKSAKAIKPVDRAFTQ